MSNNKPIVMYTDNPEMFPKNIFPVSLHGFKYTPSARPIQPKSLVLYADVDFRGLVVGHFLCLCEEILDDGTYMLRSNTTIINAEVHRCVALTHTIPTMSTEMHRDIYIPVFSKRTNRFDYEIEMVVNPFILTYN